MSILGNIFVVLFLLSMPYLGLFLCRWVDAVVAILTGDKKALDNCNLCEGDKHES